jgi:hypothetical protein
MWIYPRGYAMRFVELCTETKMNGLTIIDLDKFVQYGYPKDNIEAEEGDDSFEPDEFINNIFDKDDEYVEENRINEAEFGLGSNYRVAKPDEMKDYLGRIKNKKTTKLDTYSMPYVHGSNIIPIKDENGEDYDLDALRKSITTRPTSLLKQNEKMKHSDGTASIFFNIGLPALKGLAVNEETDEFVVVDTCPGAGACKTYCYAKKGSYIMFKAVSMKQTQTLNFLLNDPEEFASQLSIEIEDAVEKFQSDLVQVHIRWHDSGDMFSNEYLALAYSVARSFPEVKFYAYTKIADIAQGDKPKNFMINFSEGALPAEQKKVNLLQIKNSRVVPKDLFWDLIARDGNKIIKDDKGRTQFKSPEALDEFKQRMVEKYHLNKKNIITYDEMMDIPEGNIQKWAVIVTPGSGDESAARQDVKDTLLLFH